MASVAVWDDLDRQMRAAATKQLRLVTERIEAKARGIHGRSVLLLGSPFQRIRRVAKRPRYDLTVLASHGRTGLRHVLLGSVAENVVRHAPCPVLTVRPARGKR